MNTKNKLDFIKIILNTQYSYKSRKQKVNQQHNFTHVYNSIYFILLFLILVNKLHTI